jgi:hypothetical protein
MARNETAKKRRSHAVYERFEPARNTAMGA